MHTKKIVNHKRTENKCRDCRMASQCLPSKLSSDTLKKIPSLDFKAHVLEPGEHLIRQGEASHCLFAIRAGVLKSYTTLDNGREFVMGFHLPPDLFGWEAIDQQQRTVSIVALDYSNVCEIPISALNALYKEAPEIQSQLLQLVARRIAQDNLALMRSTAEQRVADFILQLSKHYAELGQSYELCNLLMTHQDIANYLRITPETVSRMLHSLQKKGIINVKRRSIYLNDINRLKEVAQTAAH